MRLIRNEQAYRRVLADFLAQRIHADAFISRFRHLWECDRLDGVGAVIASISAPPNHAGLYGLLDSINALCEAYSNSLPSGCGYRVSEEQFRKEIQSTAATLPGMGLHLA